MSAQKHRLDDASSTRKSKKLRVSNAKAEGGQKPVQASPVLIPDEVNFPRGGGTTFTPLEVQALRTEAVKEANQELFEEAQEESKTAKKRKRKSDVNGATEASGDHKTDKIRVEHLNYKRVTVGMKIFGQIVSIQPLALVVSLPNQLLGHVPVTQISTQFTALLDAAENDEEIPVSDAAEDDDAGIRPSIPALSDIFHVGQYLRTVVTAVRESRSTELTAIGRTRDEVVRASKRVELSLVPESVNDGVHKSDIRAGFTLTAAVKSIEDHGYILDLGIPNVSAFLSYNDAEKTPIESSRKLCVGQILDVSVTKMATNGRTCNVAVDRQLFANSSMSEVSKVTSVLPGMLVQCLVTAMQSTGLNVQIMGFFDGTVDQYHLLPGPIEKNYKLGNKLKARVLYGIASTSPKFALSLANHVIRLVPRSLQGGDKAGPPASLQEAYPVGTVLDAVKVIRVEAAQGLVVQVQADVQGFIHISHVSDEHTTSLQSNSGPWKIGTTHKARVTGCHPFDGILQLSFRPSIFEQKFLQAGDVHAGELVKCTITKLTESGLVVTMPGNIDGLVWPNHYADIALKHPAKRFKVGAKLKCRILAVDAERRRIALTAKKMLVDSDLPVITAFEDAKIGLVVVGVIIKVSEKNLVVEFYNKIRATIPANEASDTPDPKFGEIFALGKVVKVRIISTSANGMRIQASIRQALPNYQSPATAVANIDIGAVVSGVVTEVHKNNIILALRDTGARALISIKGLAKHRKFLSPQPPESVQVGDAIEDLVVATRNLEKGFVIVTLPPIAKPAALARSGLSLDTLTIGRLVGGRVIRHTRHGAFIKLSAHLGGILHSTDTTDDYDSGTPYPSADSVLKAVVIGIDKERRSVALSMRPSRMFPLQENPVKDREIKSLDDLKEGDTVRGFIKTVAEHGLFVSLGRDIDARVQIKELFDEYVKDWKPRFHANQLVSGRILSVDTEKKQVEMSFRSSDNAPQARLLTLADFEEGQIVDGHVKKVEDYGLFIAIENSKVSGLCHKSQLSDNKDADVTLALRGFRQGDKVKAIIRSIDTAARRISFGLKPSYFSRKEADRDDVGSQGDNLNASDAESEGGLDSEAGVDNEVGLGSNSGDSHDDDDEIRIDLDTTSHLFHSGQSPNAPKPAPVAPLEIEGGFRWSGGPVTSDTDARFAPSSEESDGGEQRLKKRKKRRTQIEQDLTADMQTRTPESNADFDRLLLGSPNSSYLWVQYMSFQLRLAEVDKAREIGRRALETINFREEQEKLNVWIAFLNLENVYGSEATLEETFQDAARHNDSKTIHLRLADIFDQTEKYGKATELYQRTCKKFGRSSKVWTLFGEYYLRRGELESARKLLPRSLQSLEQRKHLKTISKFAQMEYKLGDPERGKTIFQGIIDSHPKRWDLWSIFIDMEAGQRNIQSIRHLFESVLARKMTSHKAKSFFKKWLDLERRLGDEEGATIVKQKAIEWTERAASSS